MPRRRPIIVCAACGRKRPHGAHGLCEACYTARRRQNPAILKRSQQTSLSWKQRNRERSRAYDRAHAKDGRCSRCDGPMARTRDGGICQSCRHRAMQTRRESICRMWTAGLSMKAIAAKLGWTVTHLGKEMVDMRAAGWGLPYRYKMRDRKRVAA